MRFEYNENAVMKSSFSNCTWQQAAKYAFNLNLNKSNVTVAQVVQKGDTLEILKRKEKSESFLFKLGFDQKDVFERVTIDRKGKTVAIDTFN